MTPDSLAVDAELLVERDNHSYRVWTEGDRLVVETPSLTALRRLLHLESAIPLATDSLGDGLATAGLTVDVQVRRATVARLGDGVESDRLGEWFTGTEAALAPWGVAVAAVRALG